MSELKSEAIYRQIREQILSGALAPGTRLVTRALADDLGASDIPIREAFWMLKRDGLIEIIPYRGARVVVLTPEEVMETYVIRGHLEALATKTAVPAIDEACVERLEKHMKRMEKSLEMSDAIRYGELNREFHEMIFEWAPYPRLGELIRNLWDGNTGLRSVFRLVPERLRASHDEHRQLLERIKAGDAEGAGELALQHKLAVGDALVAALEADQGSEDGGEEASA